MTHSTKCAPAGAGTPSGANEPTQQSIEEKSVMSTIDATSDKVTCTGDVWCGCTCHSCTVTFEHCDTEPLTVPTLLVEADQQLDDGLAEIITARMGHASTAFPIGGWSVYVTEVDGNRITVTATRRDPQTREVTNREFTATITEVK